MRIRSKTKNNVCHHAKLCSNIDYGNKQKDHGGNNWCSLGLCSALMYELISTRPSKHRTTWMYWLNPYIAQTITIAQKMVRFREMFIILQWIPQDEQPPRESDSRENEE